MSLFDKTDPAKPANPANQGPDLAPLAALAHSPFPETTAPMQRGRPFQPGQSGNPAGRPKGSKNRLSESLLSILADDFAQHGADAIAQLRDKDPEAYLRLVSSLVPRELILERERQPDLDYGALTSDEAAALINQERWRRLVTAAINAD